MSNYYKERIHIMANYFINKQLQELNRIENMLSRYPNVGDNPNPNRMTLNHISLFQKRKLLQDKIAHEAKAIDLRGSPLKNNWTANQFNRNQSLLAEKPHVNLNNQWNFDGNVNESLADQVSVEERQKACASMKPNGCEPAGWLGIVVPDKPGEFNFTHACNSHDRNYSTLGMSFEEANRRFLNEMISAVQARAIPNTGKHFRGMILAQKYHDYVVKNGLPFYEKAQENAYICKFGRRP